MGETLMKEIRTEKIALGTGCSLAGRRSLEGCKKPLAKELAELQKASTAGCNDPRASIRLPDDKAYHRLIRMIVDEKKRLRPEYVVVIGIGGSNLGTMAVAEAVLGRYSRETSGAGRPKVLYADTVDEHGMQAIISLIGPVLRSGKSIILNCISKSGTTAETMANFQALLRVLKRHRKDYRKCVVVTTGRGSGLWNASLKEGFSLLPIPGQVGGRYSVFSAVGLFPLGLLGLRTDRLLKGAREMKAACLRSGMWQNPAMLRAAVIYTHLKLGKNICDNFFFSPDLESVGMWYRQLMGESIGKERDLGGRKVSCGMTPTVSIGSTDLHSMAQLYLGGPDDRLTTFISIKKEGKRIRVPGIGGLKGLVSMVENKSLKEIMDGILGGVREAYRKKQRPFMEMTLADKNEEAIGALLQLFMLEMMYLGALLNVNPFDQPAVEAYKTETKKILQRR